MAYISVPEVKEIRHALKVRFGEKLKFSVRRRFHHTVVVSILSGDIDFEDIGRDAPQRIATFRSRASTYGKHNSLFGDITRIIEYPTAEEYDFSLLPMGAYYFHLEVGKKDKLYKFTGVKK
jgi:hypothetical protein